MIRVVTAHRARTTRLPQRAVALAGCAVVLLAHGCGESGTSSGLLPVARVIGETGTQPGQFRYPRGLDTGEVGGRRVLVVVDKTARIQLLDEATGEAIGTLRTPRSDMGMPTGLTVAPDPIDPAQEAVWVADTHEHRVIVYRLPFDHASAPTEPDLAFGEYGDGPGQFIYPTDVAVRTDDQGRVDRVFVSEYGGNDRISVFHVDRSGPAPAFVFERQIGVSGVAMDASEDDPAGFARPQSIAFRRNGRELVVTNSGRHHVVRFDVETGAVIASTDGALDERDRPVEPMRFPYGLTMIDDDHAVVSEFGASTVRVLDVETGRTVRTLGVPGRHEGQLATPWAAQVVGDELIILDSGNDRVQVVRWSGVRG